MKRHSRPFALASGFNGIGVVCAAALGLALAPPSRAAADDDGIPPSSDNCTNVTNPEQRDSDGDGYGNYCDADLNNDGVVDFLDLAALKQAFFTSDPHSDLNGDGIVDFSDLGLMKNLFFRSPGPSAFAPEIVGEGGWCGGFTPIWARRQCAAGLICTDFSPLISDAPGICRKRCEDDGGCWNGQYCALDGLCRDDGSCRTTDADCDQPGNAWPNDDCEGSGVCGDGGTCQCGGLSWFATCGDPVCSYPPQPHPGVPPCGGEIQLGDTCDERGDLCDAQLGCGALLVCATSDPTVFLPGHPGCPISLRKFKKDIRYLSAEQLKSLHQEVVQMRLATWRYKDTPSERKPSLGFIIDDNPASASVAPDGQHVDLYGLTSMAVAAMQVQAKQIEALTRHVEELEQRLGKR